MANNQYSDINVAMDVAALCGDIYMDFENDQDVNVPILSTTYPPEIPNAFKNFTRMTVPLELRTLLSYGPKFVPPGVHDNLLGTVDMLDRLHTMYMDRWSNIGNVYFREMLSHYSDQLCALELNQNRSDYHLIRVFKHMLLISRQFLHVNQHLCIVQSDKGKSTAIMSKVDYNERMVSLVSSYVAQGVYVEEKGYSKLTRGIIRGYMNIQKSLKDYIESFMGSGSSSNNSSNNQHPLLRDLRYYLRILNTKGTTFEEVSVKASLPCLYGMVKSHKEGYPMRPICSSINWYSYPVQKLLTFCLKQVFSLYRMPNSVLNIDEFVFKIGRVPVCDGYVFIKIDIKDMYTSLDKNKLMALMRLWSRSPSFEKRCPIPVLDFLKLMYYSLVSSAYVLYDGIVYKQLKGLPQGACDSGTLAGIYLDYLMQMHSSILFDSFGIIYWFRYIDDFLVYIPRCNIDSFLEAFKLVIDMDITVEYEDEIINEYYGQCYQISYLDVMLMRSQYRIHVGMYVKSIASKRMVHYCSNQPMSQKLNTCLCMIRKVLIRSDNLFVVQDLEYCTQVFIENYYPLLKIAWLMRRGICKHLAYLQEEYRRTSNVNVLSRIEVLYTYLLRFVSLVRIPLLGSVCPQQHKRIVSPYVSRDCPIRVFTFRSDSLSRILVQMSGYHNLSRIVFSNRESQLHRLLKMSLVTSNPNQLAVPENVHRREHIYLVPCANCNYSYILYGLGDAMQLLTEAVSNPDTSLSRHLSRSAHALSGRMIKLSGLGDMKIGTRIMLYKVIYEAVGLVIGSKRHLGMVSSSIRQCVEDLIRDKTVGELFSYKASEPIRRYAYRRKHVNSRLMLYPCIGG